MANPGNGDLSVNELGKTRRPALAGARGEPPLPDHFVEERPGVEVIAGGKIFE